MKIGKKQQTKFITIAEVILHTKKVIMMDMKFFIFYLIVRMLHLLFNSARAIWERK